MMHDLTQLKEQVRAKIEAYWPAFIKDLADVVAINSERGETEPGYPFGKEPARALAAFLARAAEEGFETDNVDNYAGTVSYGNGAEAVGVMAHLDIVPAGKGWTSDPFTLTERGGRLYGRGVSDDKGPAVGALYGLKIIRDLGLPLTKKIQLIVGTNEEQGSKCMEYFVQHRPVPSMGFTPDAGYPLIFAEKGNLWTELSFPVADSPIRSFYGGEAFNAVPAEAVVVLDGKRVDAAALAASIDPEDSRGYETDVRVEDDGNVRLCVKGLAAHGSVPEIGVNAVVSAAMILTRFFGDEADGLLKFVAAEIGRDTRGEKLGLAVSDADSGSLSLNLGKIRYDGEERTLCIDIRYPVTLTLEGMIDAYTAMAKRYNLEFKVISSSSPHYVPKDSVVVSRLMSAYRTATGDLEAEPYAIGGGTYAKKFGGNFVAFGPEFPNQEPSNIHNFDENVVIENFKKHLLISTMAIIALAS